MAQLQPYLLFNGNCRQAMEFYQKHLGGKLELMNFSQAPEGQCPAGAENRVMHACLLAGELNLMASDATPDSAVKPGDDAYLCLSVESNEEAERLFKALSDKGRIIMPIAETFWTTRFGMFEDQFGRHWMINGRQK
ncbi:VOC family protein [Oligoflexus tunisiensis]|uniref:VOC family protein n=1 Tax=Oligoflexus tunisiensis TaxID=708132 RepID=UPI00114CA97A|nr:VOC family protein [Oligoflexus tunisiensis]